MNKLYKFNEYNEQKLNKGLISDFFSKYKDKIESIVEKKLSELSERDLNQLKKIFLPYKDLTFREIQEKIKLKLESVDESAENQDITNEMDPYGEEEWDIEKDEKIQNKRRIRRKIFKKISLIFGNLALRVVCMIPFLLIIDSILTLVCDEKSKVVSITQQITNINSTVFLISAAIFIIGVYLYRKFL